MRDDKWLKTTVGQYSPFVYGKAIKKADQKTDGIPVYGSNGIYTYSDSTIINQHAVIIGRKGSVGKVHLSTEPCWVSDTAFYVLKDSLEESYFVYYLLSSLGLEYMNTDAAVPGLNRDNAHRLEISIPDTVEKRIALVEPLIKLDQKIHLNNQINQTLESIAQAIFKSWFIDFEPVRAKIAAKQTGQDPELAAMCAISGKTQAELDQLTKEDFAELQATAALFPDELVESELGKVPKGWEVTAFGDIAELCKGTINPQSQKDVLFNHYSLPAYDNSKLPFLEKGESIKSNKTLVPDDTVLISKLNPRIPRIWYIGTVDENAICSTEFIVFRPLKNLSSSFIYCYATSLKFLESLQQLVTGTSNSHQRVKPEQIKTICEIASNNDLRIHFSKMMDSIFLEILKNRKESENLAELRDSLLPKLLSGEVSLDMV